MPIAKIYKITNGEMLPYIGSTILKRGLPRRLTYHRQSKKKWLNGKERFMGSFDLLNGNEAIELLEEIEYIDKKDILMREQYWIEQIPNCNINKAFGRKDRTEYFKQYRETHKEETHTNYLAKYKQEQIKKQRVKRELLRFLKNFNI